MIIICIIWDNPTSNKTHLLFFSFSALVEADDAPFFLPFLPILALLSFGGNELLLSTLFE